MSGSSRMDPERLRILYLSHMPASPPRMGAQARVHGLMTQLARRHELTAAMLVDDTFDLEESRRAMAEYCAHVHLVPNSRGRGGTAKRLLQAGSILSPTSFEGLRTRVEAFRTTVDQLLRRQRFDIVNLEFPDLGHLDLRLAPPGLPAPPLVVDSHEIAYDLARQFARSGRTLGRRAYGEINWRKRRRDELASYRKADGVCLCSADDERRLLEEIPGATTVVVPNAADVEFYRPRDTDPLPDGRTVVYFGLLSTIPNIDGVTHFVEDVWPRIASANPDARLKVIGKDAPPWLRGLAGPRVEMTGFVPDLRPHLASAAAVVVPLRLGGGTRLKIVEAMAMGKAIVSTTLGAEGIESVPGRDILIENEPEGFARAVNGLLADPARAARIGAAARELAVARYAWSSAAGTLEGFFRRVIEAHGRRGGPVPGR